MTIKKLQVMKKIIVLDDKQPGNISYITILIYLQ